MKTTRLDYCQYLLVSQTHYTLTNFADPTDHMSPAALNRSVRSARLTGRWVWENARGDIDLAEHGYSVFDDTVADKDSATRIELVRR